MIFLFLLFINTDATNFHCANVMCNGSAAIGDCLCHGVEALRANFFAVDQFKVPLWVNANGVEMLVNVANLSSSSPSLSENALELARIVAGLKFCFCVSKSHANQPTKLAHCIAAAFPWEWLLAIDADSFDDLLWWSLAYIRLFEQTGESDYLFSGWTLFFEKNSGFTFKQIF